MLTADELKRLREAATPKGWVGNVFGEIHSADGRMLCLYIPRISDKDLILYLVNHAAELEEALRDRDRINRCADQRIVDGIGHFDIDDRTADAMRAANDDTEEGWKIEWRKQFRAAIDGVLAEADSAAIDAARKEGA